MGAEDLTWESWVVVATLAVALIVMAFEWVGPDLTFAFMGAFFMATQIITLKEGAQGFSNTGVLTVMALFVVAEGVAQTGALERSMAFILGKPKSVFYAQVRFLIPVMFASAFLNNTPIVALGIPIAISWGRRIGISPKKLLIPLSYGAVFGGTTTLIGTSTNLVVVSLEQAKYKTDSNFNIFSITPYGFPYCIWGFVYILIASRWLLAVDSGRVVHDFTVRTRVKANSKVIGETVQGAGLSHIEQLDFAGVENKTSKEVALELEAGDIITFKGDIAHASWACDKFGLELLTTDSETKLAYSTDAVNYDQGVQKPSVLQQGLAWLWGKKFTLYQVTVKKGASIVGTSIRDLGFRGRFNAAVLAVKRQGFELPGGLGDVVLQAKDTLILETGKDFNRRDKDFTSNFSGITAVDSSLGKRYTVGMRLPLKSTFVGKTLDAAGLRGLRGLYIASILRQNGTKLTAVSGQTVLEAGDVLFFVGSVDNVKYLFTISGLENLQQLQIKHLKEDPVYHEIVEVVVNAGSPLEGRTVAELEFRELFDAVVFGIQREGDDVDEDIKNVRLQGGDVLGIIAGQKFVKLHRHDKAFALISSVPHSSPMKFARMWFALVLVVGMVTTQVVGGILGEEFINLWPCAMLTAAAMLVLRCMSAKQARNSLDWDIYVCIAFAFAVGAAMETTGVAAEIAQLFVSLAQAIGGKVALLSCLYLATALLSEILTNNASAAIMYPIASIAGDALGVPREQISICVMLGASAGFMLTFSYQCNLMVYKAGNYTNRDFLIFGGPTQAWLFLGVIGIFALQDQLLLLNLIFVGIVVVVLIAPWLWELVTRKSKSKKSSTDAIV